MTENGIIIISDNQLFIDSLKSRIVFLREADNVSFSNYKNAVNYLSENNFNIIILDGENEEITANFAKKIKADVKFQTSELIVFMDFYNDEFALDLFDAGIQDFILKSATDAEILMRLVWAHQKHERKQLYDNNQKLLYSLGILEGTNGIYSPKYCRQVFET